ncbi:uncharacterized protein LOC111391714 [Olea europaea var. sylvestris]|uniref:Uncharacterized protein n=1 Tax=Olea europaea subsp. europaea TaxID=158383 RepID=A0A8S0UL16_OLEEU|nr:uncharacterized protein LOC111391714 [Olea europaea var. sylvestris]CAA3020890.1 Hypothetical predicted protein [Olea europaea subsp. europaea]
MDKGENIVGESSGSKLNPNAKPFRTPANVARFERTPVDRDRTLLMKFSTDFPPFSQQEIHNYFTERFGNNCIESLYVPGRDERDSELGIITFSRPQIAFVIMGRWEEVVLFICTRPVHFKRSWRLLE